MVSGHLGALQDDPVSIEKMTVLRSRDRHLRMDPISRYSLVELAWFYDPSRIDEVSLWDPDALRKMRTPLLGFSHYRVSPSRMPILFELAWFHEMLMDGE